MNLKSSELRKERLKELEEDFNRTQLSASSFVNETEEVFESTIANINNSSMASSIQIGISARSSQSKANEVIRSFENIETRYRLEASNLRKELRNLEQKIHRIESLSIPLIFQPNDQQNSNSFLLYDDANKFDFDQEAYDSVFLPDLPKNESYRVDSLENQIKQIENLLSNDDIEQLEAQNQKELEYIMQLEEENKRLRNRNDPSSDLTTMSLSSFTSFSPIQNKSRKYINDSINPNKMKLNFGPSLSSNPSFTSTEINSSRVQKNIDSLISVLNDRRLRYKMDLKETKRREAKLEKLNEKQKELLSKKLEKIEQLKKRLSGLQKYSDALQQVQSNINNSRKKLKNLTEDKEQTERKNYTMARDKHANSEAIRRLNEVKGRVESKKIETDLKDKELEKRRKLYDSELEIVNKRDKIAEAREKEVVKLMNKLSSYGIDFQNKLVESQKELEARNLAASLHKKESRNSTLEQQLADLLQNASNDIYDDL